MKKTLQKIFPLRKKDRKKSEKENQKTRDLGTGILFLVIGAAMVIFSGFLLWERLFSAIDLEKIIPEKDLVLFANLESLDGLDVLAGADQPLAARLQFSQNLIFGTDLEQAKSWRGERGGIALYESFQGLEQQGFGMVTFLEVRRSAGGQEYLRMKNPVAQEQFQGHEILSFLQPRAEYCTIFRSYLSCSGEKLLLQNLIEHEETGGRSLAASIDFQQVAAGLPRQHAARVFLRTADLLRNVEFLQKYRTFFPLSEHLSALGATLTESSLQENLGISLVLFRQETVPEKDISDEASDFADGSPKLLGRIPAEATAFLWGNDLAEDLVNSLKYFQEIDPAFAITLESFLRDQAEKFFGGEISWELDLLPLLGGEFVVGSTPSGYFVLVETNDPEFAAAKAEKIKKGLVKMAARFIPRIISHTLADGTTVREVFPDENAVKTAERKEGDAHIFSLEAAADDPENRFALEFRQEEGLLFLGPVSDQKEIPSQLTKELPVTFAGPSEEVFAFLPAFLQKYFPNWKDLPEFTKAAGKLVTTPLFLRVELIVEF